MSFSDYKLTEPLESIKKGFGILKIKKPGMPLRPIISSLYSITSGAEMYILKIIRPLLKKCEFSILSTKTFTQKFMEIAPQFTKFYEVICIDAVSLFTSINVPRVVDYIIDIIYEDPEKYHSENNLGSFAPKNIFKKFMLDVLLEFNSFETLNGYYRQPQGLSMSGKLSPALSNIFFHMLESVIIKKFLDQRILLFYVRYVDDGFLIVRKRQKNFILSEMNDFDPF